MKLIDLSIPLEDGAISEPVMPEKMGSPPRISYIQHEEGAELYFAIFNCKREDLPDGTGNGLEVVHSLTHAATHLDAPWHFGPTSEGKKAKTIDEIPLDWCYGNGFVLDVRHVGFGEPILAKDMEQATRKIGYKIEPRDIALVRTDAYKLWGTKEYQTNFPGMSAEATEWLIDRGVKVMGVDAYNWDLPFPKQKELFQKTGNPAYIEECHYLGRKREYLHIEKLANLDKIPKPYGFKVACFPIKIKGGSAGWTRAVAFVE